jgi:molecular chaperone GrpE
MSNDKRDSIDEPQDSPQQPQGGATPGGAASGATPVAGGDDNVVQMPGAADALAAAREEAAELKDQLLRTLAEMENLRRRAQREKEDAAKFGISGFARDMIPVADNLRRALEAVAPESLANDEALKNLVTGVEMTERQLLSAFEKHGLKRVDAMGEKFDSNLHQAMFEVPGTGQPSGTVVQVMQPGYVLNDRLLRAAMVGVAKGDPQASGEGGPSGRVDTLA